jgi:hypothetical protein
LTFSPKTAYCKVKDTFKGTQNLTLRYAAYCKVKDQFITTEKRAVITNKTNESNSTSTNTSTNAGSTNTSNESSRNDRIREHL